MKLTRALFFSVVCFVLYLVHALFFAMNAYTGTAEAKYYLQRPFETLFIVLFELGRNTILILSLLQMRR